jgi:GTPase involved in cell partitioning and DNA repair
MKITDRIIYGGGGDGGDGGGDGYDVWVWKEHHPTLFFCMVLKCRQA